MDNDYFYFKHFKLRNTSSALKINTDGVLLAAWADLCDADSILDIGTGGGVIAFIARYRNKTARITGIDIDKLSIEEALHNHKINLTSEMSFRHCSLETFVASEQAGNYDHIISNPPFFKEMINDVPNKSFRKISAKHRDLLSVKHLMASISFLLTETGTASVIYHYDALDEINFYLQRSGLYIEKITKVKGIEEGPYKRILISLKKTPPFKKSIGELAIRRKEKLDDNNMPQYTDAYVSLTRYLYLNF